MCHIVCSTHPLYWLIILFISLSSSLNFTIFQFFLHTYIGSLCSSAIFLNHTYALSNTDSLSASISIQSSSCNDFESCFFPSYVSHTNITSQSIVSIIVFFTVCCFFYHYSISLVPSSSYFLWPFSLSHLSLSSLIIFNHISLWTLLCFELVHIITFLSSLLI